MDSTLTAPGRIPVLFDTDPGIDDALALALLACHPRFELVAITTAFGNGPVATTTRNARGLAALFGRDVPVAAGAEGPLLDKRRRKDAAHVHGDDGLGGVADRLPAPTRPLDPRPAHQAICDLVNERPGEITLVAVGPFTNLALALEHDPSIAAKVRQIVVMGGAFGLRGHGGNVSPVAEANIMADPEAADRVFTADWPVTVVGLDVTQEAIMREAELAKLRGRGDGAGDLLWQATRHYQQFYDARDGIGGIYAHDASAAAVLLVPEAFTLRAGPVRVVLEGIATGQTIQDWRGEHGADTPWSRFRAQQVCVEVDAARVLALFDEIF
ncbi:nucleoside hydrolase [Mitsuaria sp. GD03876]|uniref:nucleoside hydrolase n=1 Tax=Mitsuaria sp. GD03876 TaxID=2975399 RepID=UPI0024491D67|nr:nucleoside hydrolase [Mitsuaria sp. GD03876]MDH0865896.1 nucleoside hydrolase [Mitsuaria sp. GD03876]